MENKDVYELTNPQKSIWLTEQFYAGSTVNNICGTANINNKIDFNQLEKAINIVIKNNSSFLINFSYKDGNLMQYITEYKYFKIEIIDIKNIDEVKDIENSLMKKVFNIQDSYLFEFKIFRLPNSHGGFILNIHHLLADSWTLGLTCKKIINAYLALINNDTPSNSDYSDYFEFYNNEKNYLNSTKFEKDKEYWQSVFSSVPEVARIPSENKNLCDDIECLAKRNTYKINNETMNSINAFCKQNKISVFNFMTAIYSLYISRTTGLKDFVLGTPILNRTNFIEKTTTGMFVSTVPLRINLENVDSFTELTKDIATNNMSMLRHQKYPYELILKDLRNKQPNLPNLYNILISYQITKAVTECELNYTTNWAFNGNCADDLQIHILDINSTGELNIFYDYKSALYTSKEIDDIHNRILYIINQILSNDNSLLNNIEIVTNEDKQTLLYEYNKKLEYNIPHSIISLIEDVANKNPNSIAIETDTESITFKDLLQKVNKTANYLLNNYNLSENSNIGVFTFREIDTIISILAILKINCTFIPIDPEYPIERIKYMIETSELDYIICTKKFNKISFDKISLITINSDLIDNYSTDIIKTFNYNKENNLYIVFTSGSTGKPKGIGLKHKNMINLIFDELYNSNTFENIQNKKILQFATMSFDVSYQEIFTSLLSGGTLVLISDSTRKNMNELTKYIADKKISILFIPPAYLRLLAESNSNIELILKSVKVIITAGEALVITNGIRKLLYNGIKLYNHYGPAETHVATTFLVDKNYTNSTVPIGKAISNSRIYILDYTNNLLPKNSIGQIVISGDCVGNGYWKNENLTNEKFLNDKYFEKNIMYLTGDLGYIDHLGLIHYIGRSDFQVKINGFRIEPDGITNVLLKYPYIKTAATIIKEHLGKKYIVCYYTSTNKNLNNDDLINYLKKSLPDYMIPAKLVELNSLPLTINGKIDRKKLPDVDFSMSTQKIELAKTSTEKELIKIWKNIFKIEEIGTNFSFFELGGDSLLAIKLLSDIKDIFNVDLNISVIYSNTTIRELGKIIDSSIKNSIKITKQPKKDYYPLSNAQKRIYYASKSSVNPLVYNISGGLLIKSLLKEEKIKQIFNILIKKHSAFRTYFKIVNDEPAQFVLDSLSLQIKTFIDGDINIENLINSFPKKFEFETAPLLRVEIHYINNKQTLLLIDSHHIILDGLSLNILVSEFCKLYNDESIEDEKIEYTDYTLFECEFNKSKRFENIENNWLNTFKDVDIPVINLPYDFPVSQQKNYNGDTLNARISKELFKSLENIAKENSVSTYTLFLSAFYVLLYRYTGQNQIIVGSPISGRFDSSISNTIGMFVNNIPLLTNIDNDIKFIDFMNIVKDTVLKAMDNQPYPYDILVKALKLNANTSLFDVMFTYQNEFEDTPKIGNNSLDVIYSNTKTSKYNLSLEFIPKSNTLNLEYNTDLFKKITVTNILEHYISILKQISNMPDILISKVNMITEKEKKLLSDFNKTDGEINNDTVADLIERQAKLHPDNIAIICEDKFMTYSELDKKSNSLANYLVNNGIKANDIICIMTNRSFETIVAMVAILKAGGAFLNIDPTYPIDRTKYYIESSKTQYVLTQKSLKDKVKEIPNCVEIDLQDNPIYDDNFDRPKITINMQDLSYIIYTSGSTGIPKGVMLNQVGLTNMAKAMTKALDYLHDGKVHTLLSVTSTPFDIFVYEIIVSLTHGQRIVMANNAEHRNPKLLDKLIKKYNTDVMTVTPSLMKILYDNREPDSSLYLVKNMVFGGEPLPEKFVKDLKALADDITVFNIYGPSEITVLSNVQNLNGETEITTGPPIMNTQIHILDNNLEPLPIGVVGEIYISGIQVGMGYLGNPELTQQRFLPNKFGSGKMYKSGDIGRWTFDGKVQCLGRVDHQIKLRGLRIELGEIENKIEQVPGVSASVVNKFSIDNNEFLCGYYVTDGSIDVNELDVKNYLKKFLPHYMVPSYIVHLDKMPYTINRKIDRKALPIPTLKDNNFKEENPDNFSSDEMKLLQIWKNILKLDNISLTDDFFDIGGDSISAIKMQIEALKYNFNFEYSDIFAHPTIKELSSLKHTETVIDNSFMANYDYSKINSVLERNKLENISTISKYDVKNILLIGSTGYLGIHILDSFLKNESGIAYCLVRRKDNLDPLNRLFKKIIFYFGENYWNTYKNRIKVIEGDITQKNLDLNTNDYNLLKSSISTVINAGALVKHFGNAELFNSINVIGTQNVVDFCKLESKRLIHISTISVSGNGEKDETIIETPENINNKKIFKETSLYINQNISGVYTVSKYKAELIVLEAIYDGLDAQILRMGNITNRYSDGLFQQNVEENAFAKRLKSFIEIGAFPDYLLPHSLELSPVDLCADAVIKILEYNSFCNVFHIYNSKLMPIKLLIKCLKNMNITLTAVTDELMSKILNGILNDDSKKDTLSGIIHDIDSNMNLIYTSNIRINFDFSEKYLNKLGFYWKDIDKDYIIKYMNYFRKIGFIK